jgi:CMP-N-acetylneuraminic acid synthetase
MKPINTPSCVALIPARSGSKRITNKNIRRLNGHPMMAYTIMAALESSVFDAVILSTDSEEYAEIGRYYGAEVPPLRPPQYSGSESPDIEWVKFTLQQLQDRGHNYDCISILRPTSPFRQPETIQRAWREFIAQEGVDSLRAVEICNQHPGKMWVISGERMTPILPFKIDSTPWHSNQYAALPEIYVQNASLEIVWSHVIQETGTISGNTIMPFITKDLEGFDVNNSDDWRHLEQVIKIGEGELPTIKITPFPID